MAQAGIHPTLKCICEFKCGVPTSDKTPTFWLAAHPGMAAWQCREKLAMATYVIGDVQGCYPELMALLDAIHFNEHTDRLWFAGDLINRGANSLETLRFVANLPNHHQSVLGNHDLYFLSVVLGKITRKPSDTLADLYQAPDRDALIEWLIRQPLALYDSGYNSLVVHAGVAPHWTRETTLKLAQEASLQLQSSLGSMLLAHLYDETPLTWQDTLTGPERWRCIINCLTRQRIVTLNAKMSLEFKRGLDALPKGYLPWYQIVSRQTASTRIIFGHWAALLGDVGGDFNVVAVDTGCAWGHTLTAYRLEDAMRFSIPSQITIK